MITTDQSAWGRDTNLTAGEYLVATVWLGLFVAIAAKAAIAELVRLLTS